MNKIEKPLLICGVDEAGRGPLAGPVVAAAVILDPQQPIVGLNDSKKLSPKKRERLAAEIRQKAIAWAIAEASTEEIDTINILQATLLAMRRAIENLQPSADIAEVDGLHGPKVAIPVKAIVDGDANEPHISAASILAKTHRDTLMTALAERYPAYGFARHKGYGTALHLQALQTHGPCPEHRRSFAPVARLLSESTANDQAETG